MTFKKMCIKKSSVFSLAMVCIATCSLHSCGNEKTDNGIVLETKTIMLISEHSAQSGGIIISDGDLGIASKGVCWSLSENPTISDPHSSDGSGSDDFDSSVTGLDPGETYHVRAYASNTEGTSYGNSLTFSTPNVGSGGQIIADHTVVDKYDDIPQIYIDAVKKMWLVYAGESHSQAIRTGLELLEGLDSRFQVHTVDYGTPKPYTNQYLRASRGTWGDYSNSTGWIYSYGEEDWFTNSTAVARTKAGITYCNTHNLAIAAIGFGWCWDDTFGPLGGAIDPVYSVHWYGGSVGGPEGSRRWGLDAGDYTLTGNSVCMDTYLSATQGYIDYCRSEGYATNVFFTTGPVDTYYTGESGYQGSLKHEYIRTHVKDDATRVLFDYADILCYDSNGSGATATWDGHTYPIITSTNLGDGSIGHISSAGSIRLAKAMWWMLARMAGWDGN